MQLRDKFAISFAGLTGVGQRGIFAAMFVTLAIASGTWCVVYGLLTGAETVSQHRIDSMPFPYRLMLGRQYTSISQAQFDDVEKRVDDIPDNALKQMHGLRVLFWNLGLLRSEEEPYFYADTGGNTKGRTIATDALGKVDGEYHPVIHALGLALDRTDKFKDGIFLCPRALDYLGISLEQVPDKIALDLKTEETDVNVLGVLKDNPPERVFFLCPEPFEKELRTQPKSVRFSPKSGCMLDKFKGNKQRQEEYAQKLVEKLQQQRDIYEVEIDRTLVSSPFRFIRVRGDERSVSRWKELMRSVAKDLEIDEGDFETVEFPSDPLSYAMIEMYFHSGASLPEVVNAMDDLTFFEGEVDRTVAEMVTQLESFSAARLAVLGVMRWALAAICVVCLSVIQIMRCLQRKEQAAMLRIMGMSHWQLIQVALCDGFLVWLVGLAIWWPTAIWGLGPHFAAVNFPDPAESKIAFQFTCWDVLWLGGFSLLFTEFSACSAAYFGWLRKHPADMF